MFIPPQLFLVALQLRLPLQECGRIPSISNSLGYKRGFGCATRVFTISITGFLQTSFSKPSPPINMKNKTHKLFKLKKEYKCLGCNEEFRLYNTLETHKMNCYFYKLVTIKNKTFTKEEN